MNISRWIVRFTLTAIAHSILPSLAIARPAAPDPEMVQTCPGLVAGNHATVIPVAWYADAPNLGGLNSVGFNLAALNSDQVRLTFLGHATFLIESPELVRIATDYNDYVKSLRGWARVRNVPTNIRSFYGSTTTERYGNFSKLPICASPISDICIIR
jgi:hypothetical protein